MGEAPDYVRLIRRLRHPGLARLWDRVRLQQPTPGWPRGRAFEHLVIRAFELEGVAVRYPFQVSLPSGIREQIDGVVYAPPVTTMVESKDQDTVDVEPLAKLRSQLFRRPAGVIGVVFCRGRFTLPAAALAGQFAPQSVLLWNGNELDAALRARRMTVGLTAKYRAAVELGICDFNLLEGGPS